MWISCSKFDKPWAEAKASRCNLRGPKFQTFLHFAQIMTASQPLHGHICLHYVYLYFAWSNLKCFHCPCLAWCKNTCYYSDPPEPEPPFQIPRSTGTSLVTLTRGYQGKDVILLTYGSCTQLQIFQESREMSTILRPVKSNFQVIWWLDLFWCSLGTCCLLPIFHTNWEQDWYGVGTSH